MADRWLGTVVGGRFRLRRLMAHGYLGALYEAEKLAGGESEGLASVQLVRAEGALCARVEREIAATAALSHPHLLAYLDSGELDVDTGYGLFFASELADYTLRAQLTDRGPLTIEECEPLALALAEALVYLHETGLVHRDVQPDQVYSVSGVWKLGAFGLTRAMGEHLAGGPQVFGQVQYTAPEIMAGQVGPASDVYSLGVTLLEAITGRPAHDGDTAVEVITDVLRREPRIPPDLPSRWRAMLADCLVREPGRRVTAAGLAHALGAQGRPVAPPTATPAALTEAVAQLAGPLSIDGGRVRSPRWLPWVLRLAGLAAVGCIAAGLWYGAHPVGHEPHRPRPAGLTAGSTAGTTGGGTTAGAGRTSPAAAPQLGPCPITLAGPLKPWQDRMPTGLRYRLRERDGMPQVLVPAGVVTTGATAAQLQEIARHLDQGPDWQKPDPAVEGARHKLNLPAFWMDLHPVTAAQYRQFCQATQHAPSERPEWNGETHPRVMVSWEDAVAYARWVGAELPTNDQWERASRAGVEGRLFPWGSSPKPPDGAGNFSDETRRRETQADYWIADYDDGYSYTSAIGSFPPNAYGLFDMAGNVWQWCRDHTGTSEQRPLRGGSYGTALLGLRLSLIGRDVPTLRDRAIGFRCAQGETAGP